MSERRREQGDVKTLPKERVDKPKLFKVIFHNDDYTTMEFVVQVLIEVFKHSQASATRLMLTIHKQGTGVAGVYTYEVAETKIEIAMELARELGHPLQLTIEPE